MSETPSKNYSGRIPPGQTPTTKFPVMSLGPHPKIDLHKWELRLFGQLKRPFTLNWEQFIGLPQVIVEADFHCVTQWSRLGNAWSGVSASTLIGMAELNRKARYVMVHCHGGYTVNLELDVLLARNVLFAHRHDGAPLEPGHGGPVRLVVPHRYGWKSAKWVKALEFLEINRDGFWESLGYHARGDPWKEERFADGNSTTDDSTEH